jgi:hypothetical protein
VTNEKDYIRVALAQRWKFQGKNIQSIKEILPKSSLPHRNPKIPIGRRDDSDIDLHGAITADGFKLPLLKYPQQLHLQFCAHFGDFIEKKCSAVGELETTLARIYGARKSATYMTKQFAFQKFLWDRATIDRHKASILPWTQLMDCARRQLLSSAAFPSD